MTFSPTIWINAGETSGDLHGQILARALRQACPDVRLLGMAGPAMRDAGVEALFQTEALSVMGVTEVLGQLPRIIRLLHAIKTELQTRRPDVIVVIDAPDFHFRVIKAARELGIPVIYYISPKLWAWRQGRARFLRRYVRRLISILPFETAFYARFGMHIDYVGHPLLDQTRAPEILAVREQPGRIGILPGSRKREITALLPIFSRAAELLSARFPNLEFILPVAPGVDRELIRKNWSAATPVTLAESAKRYEVMRSCRAILAASGTAALETALLGVPTAVAYKVSPLSFAVGKLLVHVPFISLPNLILGKAVFPEFLQNDVKPEKLADTLASWIPDTRERASVTQNLEKLPALLGGGNAANRAADIILSEIRRSS